MSKAVRLVCLDIGIEPGKDTESSLTVWLRNEKPGKVVLITTSRKSFRVPDLENECCLVEEMDKESTVEHLRKCFKKWPTFVVTCPLPCVC